MIIRRIFWGALAAMAIVVPFAFSQGLTIGGLPTATSVADGDAIIIWQTGVTRQIARSVYIPVADATTQGRVELATTAEVTTGTDSTRVVTPNALENGFDGSSAIVTVGTLTGGDVMGLVPQASTTVEGKIELATSGEVTTGTDALKAVTPSTLENGFDGSANIATVAQGAVTAHEGAINHDSLSGFVANEHLNFTNQTASQVDLAASGNYEINNVAIIDDAAGTTTLQNIDDVDATTRNTISDHIMADCPSGEVLLADRWDGSVATGNQRTLRRVDRAVTITRLYGVKRDANDIRIQIQHASTRNAGTPNDLFTAGTGADITSQAGQEINTGFEDATIPADSWVWAEYFIEGTPTTAFFFQVCMTID